MNSIVEEDTTEVSNFVELENSVAALAGIQEAIDGDSDINLSDDNNEEEDEEQKEESEDTNSLKSIAGSRESLLGSE